MSSRRRLRQNGFSLVIALGLAWALIALVGLPPIGEAAEFWIGGRPMASSGAALVISLLWIAVAVVLVYAMVTAILSVGHHIDIIRRERRRNLLLGSAGFAIGLLAPLISHTSYVHPGSVSIVLALVRHHWTFWRSSGVRALHMESFATW